MAWERMWGSAELGANHLNEQGVQDDLGRGVSGVHVEV